MIRRPAVTAALAGALVWVTLAAPDRPTGLDATSLIRLPLELVLLLAVAVLLPPAAHRVFAVVVGLTLVMMTVRKLLDFGFRLSLYRPFDPVVDWRYSGSLAGLVIASLGRTTGTVVLVVALALLLVLLVALPAATLKLTRLASRHQGRSTRLLAVLAVVWLALASLGVRTGGDAVANATTTTSTYQQIARVPSVLRDEHRFAASASTDALRDVPAADLLTGLRGKDVVFVFVESYGSVALHNPDIAPGVTAVLRSGTSQLAQLGYSARSAFLTSPTFGGISWLAHSTLQSGLWVDSQERYDTLVGSRRSTLTETFARAGWRTVADIPANTRDWPQRAFYHYDAVYDSRNVGYAGPGFGYATMPDQFTLATLQRLELTTGPRPPVMAEVDLVSSHTPWTPLPSIVPQDRIGDGSVFAGMPERSPSQLTVWRSARTIRRAYGASIEYSLQSLIDFAAGSRDDRLVVVFLGDHQPAPIVSGDHADHNVPITVLTRDAGTLRRVAGWGWDPGMAPSADAPVWRMDGFRDRFLEAFRK